LKLDRGRVVLVRLDPPRGHEQRGTRPCIIVSDPEITSDQRFPLVGVIPLSGVAAEGALYPRLEPGRSGLRKVSYALVDQVRSVDKRRVERVFGRIATHELDAVDLGLTLFLGLA
jgi:mRNA interferase MazF